MGQLLVALDVESGARALELAETLHDFIDGVKIGSRLFTLEGPALVRRRRVDRLALLLLVLVAAAAAVSVPSGSPELLLARGSVVNVRTSGRCSMRRWSCGPPRNSGGISSAPPCVGTGLAGSYV